jgi:ABC-type branched-subunit amino acid transport system substrate-binding protein
MDLYAGIMYSLSNLDSTNSLIEIFPFDTKSDPDVVNEIIDSGYLDGMDLIIGPLYSKPVSIIKQYCLENKLLMINPLSSNHEIIEDNNYSLLFK